MKAKKVIHTLRDLCAFFAASALNFFTQRTQRLSLSVQKGFVVYLIIIAHFAQAQSIADYLQIAGANNPALKAKYSEYYSALEKVPQAGTLPDPELSFAMFISKEGLYMERFMGQQLSDISVMQMFPWFGSLDAAKNEATYMAQMKFASFQEAKINLFHDVRSVWFKLYQIDQDLKLLEQEKAILKTYEQLALTRFKTGTSGSANPMSTSTPTSTTTTTTSGGMSGMSMGGNTTSASSTNTSSNMGGMQGGSSGSMVDVLLIQLQMKELETRIEILKASRKPLATRFNNLLNRSSSEPITIADTLTSVQLPASLSVIQDSVVQNHPMVKMYAWDEKAREAQQRMATLMGRPMIGVGVTYMVFRPRQDELMNVSMGGDNMFMPMVTMTLPIYRKKYTAQRKEAEYLYQSASQNKEAAKLDLLSELEQRLNEYENNNRQLQLLDEQITITHQAIRLMTTAYSTGTRNMEEILRLRQTLLNYQQQQNSSITEQHITVSGITKLMGIN